MLGSEPSVSSAAEMGTATRMAFGTLSSGFQSFLDAATAGAFCTARGADRLSFFEGGDPPKANGAITG